MAQRIIGAKGKGGSGDKGGNRGTEIASVAYMKLLLALSEGEIAGGFTGKDIYLDGTPLLDDNGSENFPGVTWEWRSGLPDQDYIQGFPAVENEIGVSTELKYGTPWVKSITNTQLSAIRLRFKFPQGIYAMRDSGGKDAYRIDFAIDISTDGSTYEEYGTDHAEGIANTGYERSYRIDLPAATSGWQIRVRRLTQNTTDGRHADISNVESMTEIVDAKLRYPNTALLFIQFDSKLFDGKTPTVTVNTKGLIVRVPSNYDPESRTYTDNWDGTFKWSWTNNPAWIFYDLVLNKRYGLGRRIGADQVDKWTLYLIGRYCDDKVSDGRGGKEARHQCDLYLSQRADAWQVIMDLANIFQGMIGWSNNLLTLDADMPRELDPDFVFNKSNIVGSFTFSSSSEKANYSAAIITYSNPANHYNDDQASASVQRLSDRFGFNQLEMSAVGCARETEAQRRGLWAIETNSDDNAVEFKTGREGRIPRVGKIIGINNARQAGRANGGRVAAATATKITLDRLTTAAAGDRLIINLPSGKSEGRVVKSVSGRAITVETGYSETPSPESAWVLDQPDLAIQQFRVKRVAINDDGTVTIGGLPYNPNKFERIENGAVIEDRPVTVVPPRGQPAPENIRISSLYRVEQGIGITTMEVTWDSVAGAVAYEAQWRQNNGDWVNVPRTGNTRFTVDGIYAGRYTVRVRSVNGSDIASMWALSAETELTGKVGKPPLPVNFRTTPLNWAVQLDWGMPAGAGDTAYTEIQYSTVNDGSQVLLLSDVPYPQATYSQMGLRAGQNFWYRARLVDRLGNKSDWTEWVYGGASSEAEGYLIDIDKNVRESEPFKQLTAEVGTVSEEVKKATEGLSKEVQDRINGDQAEATARAGALLTEKLAREASVENVQTQLQTATDSIAQQIAQVAAGTGEQFDSLKIWYFDTTAEDWTGNGAPTIIDGWLRPADHATDPCIFSPAGLGIPAASYRFLKLRVKKVGKPSWQGQIFWKGNDGPDFNEGRSLRVPEPYFNADGIATLDFDDVNWLAAGTINRIRLDLTNNQDANNYVLIDWIAVGRPTPGAGMAALQSESLARVNDVSAEATQRQLLAAQMRGDYTGNDLTKVSTGLIASEMTARVEADKSTNARVDTLKSSVDNNSASIDNQLITEVTTAMASAAAYRRQRAEFAANDTRASRFTAEIARVDTTIANKEEATAASMTQLEARMTNNVGQVSATVRENSQAITRLNNQASATWSLKVQVEANGVKRIAGIALGADANGSNFVLSADTFAFYNPTTGGQELLLAGVGGQLFIRSALIMDGSIDNAKIGNYIQSTNYIAGTMGWRIDKNGTIEINGAVTGQGRLVITNNRIVSYDQLNRPAAVMGQRL